jgi:hypothetical protein
VVESQSFQVAPERDRFSGGESSVRVCMQNDAISQCLAHRLNQIVGPTRPRIRVAPHHLGDRHLEGSDPCRSRNCTNRSASRSGVMSRDIDDAYTGIVVRTAPPRRA